MIRGSFDHRATLILAVVAPSLAVGVARFIPAGPASASASTQGQKAEQPPMLPRADVGVVELNEAQQAMARAAAAAAENIGPNPFRSEEPEGDEPIISRIDPVTMDDTPLTPSAPDFQLTAIVSGRRTAAMIDGAACTVGKRLRGGWKVASIDPDTQRVILRHKVLGDITLTMRPE